jgi:hypothetical protein
LFEAVGFACQMCYLPGQAGTAPGDEEAPAKEPVGAFEVLGLLTVFEKVLEQGVQGFCFIEGEA